MNKETKYQLIEYWVAICVFYFVSMLLIKQAVFEFFGLLEPISLTIGLLLGVLIMVFGLGCFDIMSLVLSENKRTIKQEE